MKKSNFIISLIFTLSALSTISLYALAGGTVAPSDDSAVVLANSANQDADFDGILNKKDKCPYSTEYKMVRFNANDSVKFLNKKITLKEVSEGENGIGVMTFDVDGVNYGVDPGKETSIPGKSSSVIIKGLFSSYMSDDPSQSESEAIVVLRRGNIDISTGCKAK